MINGHCVEDCCKNLRNEKSCKDVACVVLVPSVLLSLVLIGVCTLIIYLHFLSEYHAEIDKLTSESQASCWKWHSELLEMEF